MIVNMSENPFKCDCKISDFVRHLKFQNNDGIMKNLRIIADGLKCEQPEMHKGHLLTALETDDLYCDEPFYQYQNTTCRMKCDVRLKFKYFTNVDMYPIEGNENKKEVYQFNCSNRNLTRLPTGMCIAPGTHVELDLSNNKFTRLPVFENSEDYDAVTKLVLSKNRITFLSGILSFKNLQVCELYLFVTHHDKREFEKPPSIARLELN